MFKIILYLIGLAIIHALWEVQIEGKHGWARNLPCFRLNVFFRKLLGGKPLTGYHCYMLILFQVLFHGVYLFVNYDLKTELILQGLFIWYFVLEDIMWFVVNPHYTIRKFKKHQVEWHKRWFLGLPLSYWVMGIISTILILLGR